MSECVVSFHLDFPVQNKMAGMTLCFMSLNGHLAVVACEDVASADCLIPLNSTELD